MHATVEVIQSDAPPESQPGLGFKSWRYSTVKASIGKPDSLHDICADSGCGASLVDREFLAREVPDFAKRVKQIADPVKVKGIGGSQLETKDYLPIEFQLPGTLPSGSPAVACFTRHAFIVDSLRAQVLLGNNILGPEKMVLDLGRRTIKVGSYQDLTTELNIVNRGTPVKRAVRADKLVTVPANSVCAIPFRLRGQSDLPTERDFMFLPSGPVTKQLGPEGGIFSHIVDAHTGVVQARNTTSQDVVIPRNMKLGFIQEYEEDGCYFASQDDAHLAVNSGSSTPAKKSANWVKKAMTVGVAAMAAFQGVFKSPSPATEAVLPSGIIVYGDNATQAELAKVADSYPKLWHDNGSTVRVPEDSWMPITIKPDSKIEPAKVYPVGPYDKQLIDETFDKLHSHGRMEYTTQPTPYGYPVFVVWRTVPGPNGPERKGRVVVDIRGLNKIAVTDTYLMPLQSDITSAVAGCQYISVFDAAGFFHQWLVRLADRYKLTVVSHRGQEQFNVVVIGFKNSPAYVQR